MEDVEPTTIDQPPPEESSGAEMDAGESLALAAAQYRSLNTKPRKPRLRVLGIPLPIAGISWTGSILIHAALIVIGTVLYRHFLPPPKLDMALGDGGTHAVGIMWRESTPGGAGLPQPSEVDPAQTPPADSMAAAMNQLEKEQPPDPQVNSMAWSYAAPELIGGAHPQIGTGHGGSSLWGSPARPRGTSQSHSPTTPAAQPGAGTGHGKSAGAGRGDVSGGQAGVPTGTPDPTLPAPVYPEESRRRGEQGPVKLSINILGDGTVGTVAVVSQPPYPRLTRRAIDTIKQAHFDRAYAGITLVVTYNFVLH